jgi:hypothetical protein
MEVSPLPAKVGLFAEVKPQPAKLPASKSASGR